MPAKRCTKGGVSGWKWGDSGTCYIGPDAKDRALAQGAAIEANVEESDEEVAQAFLSFTDDPITPADN